jgi:hypothetical protein
VVGRGGRHVALGTPKGIFEGECGDKMRFDFPILAIRPGVLWRKGSFGTQSVQGSRFVEAMMTVVATLKQQHRNPLDYLMAACEAALRDEPAPSLLPADHLACQRTAA